jgi:cytochrome bd-type quinol oxidase subunit 2
VAAPRSRRLRNQAAPVTHTRSEWVLAVVGSAAVVLVTVVLIWAMRPGSPNSFTAGKGGLIHRQPRVSLMLLATAAVMAIVAWLILRPESKVKQQRRAALLSVVGVVVAAVAVFAIWHNTLVHDYAVPPPDTTIPPTSVPSITTVPTITTTPTPSTTAAHTSTTVAGSPSSTLPTPTTTGSPSTTG